MSNSSKLNTEYLIILEKNSVNALFKLINSDDRFKELLCNESSLVFQSKKIKFKSHLFDYTIKHGVVEDKDQRYFYVSISTTTNESQLSDYKLLLKEVRTVVKKQGFIVETLQNDLAFHFSCLAYSLIHDIENLMRKFITFFMIANVGKDWVKNSSPENIKKVLNRDRNNNGKEYASELHKLDFGHLGEILFSSYQTDRNDLLYQEISSYNDNAEIDLKKLREFIPNSNWDKYFKSSVTCEGSFLKSKWGKLTELRNLVAHAADLSEEEYNDIVDIIDEIKPILIEGYNKLDNLKLESRDRIQISERVATSLNARLGVLFKDIKECEAYIRDVSGYDSDIPIEKIIDGLRSSSDLENDTLSKLNILLELKSNLAAETVPSENNINELAGHVSDFKLQIQETWSLEVFKAMKVLGGKATLEQVYDYIKKSSKRTFYSSWKSSIRAAIYTNSSDVELYNGKFDIYKKINKGLWMIREDIDEKTLGVFLGDFYDKNT